jgi:hypothetical protein
MPHYSFVLGQDIHSIIFSGVINYYSSIKIGNILINLTCIIINS